MSTPTVTTGESLPSLEIHADPTFIVSTALATRDFQDVHHDRDKAQQRGSKDIFVNILTDTGLVQRYVTDWAAPRGGEVDLAETGCAWYAYDTLTLSVPSRPSRTDWSPSTSPAPTVWANTSRPQPLS